MTPDPAADPAADKAGSRRRRGGKSPDGVRRIVYVLGSTRSGTSALRNAIVTTRFKGYGEGHMEPMLSAITREVRAHKARHTPGRGNAHSKLEDTALLGYLFRAYEAYLSGQQRSDYLVDKTPSLGAIRAAPMFNRLHTRPKFLFCARRHVDNVQSKLKKFPEQSFERSCATWAACNAAWREVREALDGNFLEFDFHRLTTDPAGIAAQIAGYLELDAEEEALMGDYLVSERPQAAPGRDLTRFLKLSETGWSADQQARFREICGPMGAAYGYGEETYFAEDAEVQDGEAQDGEAQDGESQDGAGTQA